MLDFIVDFFEGIIGLIIVYLFAVVLYNVGYFANANIIQHWQLSNLDGFIEIAMFAIDNFNNFIIGLF